MQPSRCWTFPRTKRTKDRRNSKRARCCIKSGDTPNNIIPYNFHVVEPCCSGYQKRVGRYVYCQERPGLSWSEQMEMSALNYLIKKWHWADTGSTRSVGRVVDRFPDDCLTVERKTLHKGRGTAGVWGLKREQILWMNVCKREAEWK